MEYRDRDFVDEEVTLDGNVFTGCTFKRCVLVFAASDRYKTNVCVFDACRWRLDGSALVMVDFLKTLYAYPAGRDLVESLFQDIRGGA